MSSRVMRWIGERISLVDDILPAAEWVRQMEARAEKAEAEAAKKESEKA